jgi:hypothetical protein
VGSDGSAATMRGACARMVIALLLANTREAVRAWLCANAGTLNMQSMRQVGDCIIVCTRLVTSKHLVFPQPAKAEELPQPW